MKGMILFLATTLLSASSFVAQAETRSKPDSNDYIVEKCESAIRAKVKNRYGNKSGALIHTDTLNTYFVSNGEEGLRGNGSVKYTKYDTFPTYSFNCIVDTNEDKVTKLNIEFTDPSSKPTGGETNRKPKYDEYTVNECQKAIAEQAKRRYGNKSSAVINTDSLTAIFISNGEEGLRGNGSVKYANTQNSTNPNYYFTCAVDTRKGKVSRLDVKFKP